MQKGGKFADSATTFARSSLSHNPFCRSTHHKMWRFIDVVIPACCAGWGAQALCATGSITK